MDIVTHWQNFDFKIAVLLFVAYLFIDAMYAYYTLSVIKKKPIVAASVGSIMYVLLAFGVLNYVQNYLYVIPIALVSWIGTYLVVMYDLRSGI